MAKKRRGRGQNRDTAARAHCEKASRVDSARNDYIVTHGVQFCCSEACATRRWLLIWRGRDARSTGFWRGSHTSGTIVRHCKRCGSADTRGGGLLVWRRSGPDAGVRSPRGDARGTGVRRHAGLRGARKHGKCDAGLWGSGI